MTALASRSTDLAGRQGRRGPFAEGSLSGSLVDSAFLLTRFRTATLRTLGYWSVLSCWAWISTRGRLRRSGSAGIRWDP
jgi:hypothetical protein